MNNSVKSCLGTLSIVLPVILVLFMAFGIHKIEVTTVKGYWESHEFENGIPYMMHLAEDTCVFVDPINLEIWKGSWQCKGDTIKLYTEKGIKNLAIYNLTQNTMTIHMGENKYLVMSRIYAKSNADDSDKFWEVFELKGGFWYYICYFVHGICYIGLCLCTIGGICCALWEGVKLLGRMMKKIISKLNTLITRNK